MLQDGLGRKSDVKNTFVRGLGWLWGTPLAERFVEKCMPIAKERGVDANAVFRRPWDQFVMSLREGDLISNEEQCRLMYGDGVLGVSNQLPLFMYAGKVKALIRKASKIAQQALTSEDDEDFRLSAMPDEVTEEASHSDLA
jgi:hypothetical protein